MVAAAHPPAQPTPGQPVPHATAARGIGHQTLHQRLRDRWSDLAFEVQASVGSTNSVLLERARLGSMTPSLLMALAQTEGRGRLGRSWLAEAGASLTFSLAVPMPRVDWSGLSLAVGVAVADALDLPMATQPPRIGLKWPNDLLLQMTEDELPRKLGGILIESFPTAEQRWAVIGIGLNVRPLPATVDTEAWSQPPSPLSQGYACLREIHPGIDAIQALALVAEPLLDALDTFARDGFESFHARFARRDRLVGHELTTTLPDCPRGLCEGTASDGALLLNVDGQTRRVVSGEVSVRLAQRNPANSASSQATPMQAKPC